MIPANKNAAKGAAGAIVAVALALPVVMQWEGVSLRAYKDRLAYGIPTVCYGETQGVDLNKTYTMKECADMLGKRLPEYQTRIRSCLKREVPANVEAALIVLGYNIGTSAVCGSTALRKINAGDYRGGCNAFLMWTNSGGQFRQGLLNRRKAEQKLCLEGL
jgi:lysozyme